MTTLTTLTTGGRDPELSEALEAGLDEFNFAATGTTKADQDVFSVKVTDDAGAIVGGLWGQTGYGWLFTQLLAVPDKLRGGGWGNRLMDMAEAEARVRGCHSAWLDTFEFQARGFYEKLGYECFGQIDGYPPGFSRFFMKKTLQAVP